MKALKCLSCHRAHQSSQSIQQDKKAPVYIIRLIGYNLQVLQRENVKSKNNITQRAITFNPSSTAHTEKPNIYNRGES